MDTSFVEVNFHAFCASCEHFKKEESDEPCATCLEFPVRAGSKVPVNWKQKRKSRKMSQKN